MADLYSLLGQNASTGAAGVGSAITGALGSAALPAMLVNPVLGGLMSVGSGIASIFTHKAEEAKRRAAGEQMYNNASTAYNKQIADNPSLYTTQSVQDRYSNAINAADKNFQTANTGFLNKYNGIQERLLRNRINSGLTTGAAQANAVQQNMAFQNQYMTNAGVQGQQMANLRLQQGQAIDSKLQQIAAQKRLLANDSLAAQGVSNAEGLGMGAAKLLGGL